MGPVKLSLKIKLILIIFVTALLTLSVLTLLLFLTPGLKSSPIVNKNNYSPEKQESQSLSQKQSQKQASSQKRFGRLEGKVLDRSGNPLKAQVSLKHAKTGTVAVEIETNEQGQFAFKKIPAGDYYLRAKKDNLLSEFVPIHIFSKKTTTQNIYLDLQTKL